MRSPHRPCEILSSGVKLADFPSTCLRRRDMGGANLRGADSSNGGTIDRAMNIHATLDKKSARPHLLMCPPRHFAVTYSINPWMDPLSWAGDGHLHAEAQRQWAALREALIAAGAAVESVEPAPDLPDLVFTANAAVVLDGKAVL